MSNRVSHLLVVGTVVVVVVVSGCSRNSGHPATAEGGPGKASSQKSEQSAAKAVPVTPTVTQARTQAVLQPCRVTATGRVVLGRDPVGAMKKLVGIVVACEAGPDALSLRIDKSGTYTARRPTAEHDAFAFIQPININGVKFKAAGSALGVPTAFAGTVMTKVEAEGSRPIATFYHGWIKTIAGARDRLTTGPRCHGTIGR